MHRAEHDCRTVRRRGVLLPFEPADPDKMRSVKTGLRHAALHHAAAALRPGGLYVVAVVAPGRVPDRDGVDADAIAVVLRRQRLLSGGGLWTTGAGRVARMRRRRTVRDPHVMRKHR